MQHQTFLKVRGYHLDLYDHVNNARYLEFMEEARWSFFDEIQVSEKSIQENLAFVIVKMEIDFRHEARMNDELVIVSSIEDIRKTKMLINQKIYLKNEQCLVVGAKVHFVLLDRITGKMVSVKNRFPHLNTSENE